MYSTLKIADHITSLKIYLHAVATGARGAREATARRSCDRGSQCSWCARCRAAARKGRTRAPLAPASAAPAARGAPRHACRSRPSGSGSARAPTRDALPAHSAATSRAACTRRGSQTLPDYTQSSTHPLKFSDYSVIMDARYSGYMDITKK